MQTQPSVVSFSRAGGVKEVVDLQLPEAVGVEGKERRAGKQQTSAYVGATSCDLACCWRITSPFWASEEHGNNDLHVPQASWPSFTWSVKWKIILFTVLAIICAYRGVLLNTAVDSSLAPGLKKVALPIINKLFIVYPVLGSCFCSCESLSYSF